MNLSVIVDLGSRVSIKGDNASSASTSLNTLNCQVAISTLGVEPKVSTGNLSIKYWPGETRWLPVFAIRPVNLDGSVDCYWRLYTQFPLVSLPNKICEIAFALVVARVALQVRRLHDLNMSGWYFLLMLIPMIGWAFWLLSAFLRAILKKTAGEGFTEGVRQPMVQDADHAHGLG